MGLYAERVLPRLLALAMRAPRLVPSRARIGAAAEGVVLELGIGSGLNLPFYGPAVREVIGVEPSAALRRFAAARAAGGGVPLTVLEGTAERLPVATGSVDTVVTTWTLCSVGEPHAALAEALRILRPGGRLLFAEHGLAPDPGVARWQRSLTPGWRRLAGGCHLDRRVDALLDAAGFRIERLETGYLGGPRVATFMYQGAAQGASRGG
jgi:SAM-dependent methyltransferase